MSNTVLPSLSADRDSLSLPVLPEGVKRIHTRCKECYFAQWEKSAVDEEGKPHHSVQTGCELGRICKFHDLDEESVVEVEDDDSTSYLINGRYCKAFRRRDGAWAKKLFEENPKPKARLAKAIKQVNEEMKVRVGFVIPLVEGEVPKGGLTKTVKSLLRLSKSGPQSQCLYIVNNLTSTTPSQLNNEMWELIGNKLTWRLMNTYEFKEGEVPKAERICDLAIERMTKAPDKGGRPVGEGFTHYCVVRPGYTLPPTFLKDVNEALNDRLERFVVLADDGNIVLIQAEIYAHPEVGGYKLVEYMEPLWDADGNEVEYPPEDYEGKKILLSNVVDKVRRFAFIQKKEHLVRPLGEVVKVGEAKAKSKAKKKSSKSSSRG